MKKIINIINEDFFDDVESEEITNNEVADIEETDYHYKYFIWYAFEVSPSEGINKMYKDIVQLKNRLEYAYDSLFQFVGKHSELKIYKDYPLTCKDEFRTELGDTGLYLENATQFHSAYIKSLTELMIGSYVDVNMKTVGQFDRFVNFIFGSCNANTTAKIGAIKVQIQEEGKNCYNYAMYNHTGASWRNCAYEYKPFIDCFFPLGTYGKYCEKHNHNNRVVVLSDNDTLYRKDGFIYTDEFAEDILKIGYQFTVFLSGEETFIGAYDFDDGYYLGSVNYHHKVKEQPPIEEIQKWVKNRKMDLFATWHSEYDFYFMGTMVWNDMEWSISLSVSCTNENNTPIVDKYIAFVNLLRKYGCSKSDLSTLIDRDVFDSSIRDKIIKNMV